VTEKMTDFYTPEKDKDGLRGSQRFRNGLPKVFLIGPLQTPYEVESTGSTFSISI